MVETVDLTVSRFAPAAAAAALARRNWT